jgi:subtilisin family serine protease
MENTDHIILRRRTSHVASSTPSVARDLHFASTPAWGERAPALLDEAELEIASLSAKGASDVAAEPGHLVAEVLPTTLIHPVASALVDPPFSGGTSWGVEAVGAACSRLTGAGVKVAVLDTGIDASHESFRGMGLLVKDFVGKGDHDEVGHGTHCAGTIAGRDINGHRFGVAPGIGRLLIGKVLGPEGGATDAIAKGILWAREQGAHVISMSLGIDFPGAVARWVATGMPIQAATSRALTAYLAHVRLFEALAEIATGTPTSGQPTLLVAAAGNESARSAALPYTVASSPPAGSRGFISVGALRKTVAGSLVTADFSNTGVDLMGPGADVLSCWPGGRYACLSGTSMAVPHVAGVAALWLQRLWEAGDDVGGDLLAVRLLGSGLSVTGVASSDGGAGLVLAPQEPSRPA